jgi:hypothetical protein
MRSTARVGNGPLIRLDRKWLADLLSGAVDPKPDIGWQQRVDPHQGTSGIKLTQFLVASPFTSFGEPEADIGSGCKPGAHVSRSGLSTFRRNRYYPSPVHPWRPHAAGHKGW